MSASPSVNPALEWYRRQEEKKNEKQTNTDVYILYALGIIILIFAVIWVISVVYGRRSAPTYQVIPGMLDKNNSIAPRGAAIT